MLACEGPFGLSEAGASMVAGMLAGLCELTLLFAHDQLLQALRGRELRAHRRGLGAGQPDVRAATGRARSFAAGRVPRAGAGHVNPYLALAGLIAAALDGMSRSLPLPPPITGNAYLAPSLPPPFLPAMDEARSLWGVLVPGSGGVRRGRGGPLRDDGAGRSDAYRAAELDWELRRYFERIEPGAGPADAVSLVAAWATSRAARESRRSKEPPAKAPPCTGPRPPG